MQCSDSKTFRFQGIYNIFDGKTRYKVYSDGYFKNKKSAKMNAAKAAYKRFFGSLIEDNNNERSK